MDYVLENSNKSVEEMAQDLEITDLIKIDLYGTKIKKLPIEEKE